jgi:hypothetical protein
MVELAFPNSRGYRDNPTAIPLLVVARGTRGENSEAAGPPDTQTTRKAPFDTVADIGQISQVAFRIPQYLLFTGLYRKIGLETLPVALVDTLHRAYKCASAVPAACA